MRAAGTPLITPTTALALLAGICTCLSLPQVPPLVMAVLSVAAGSVLVWRWSSRRWIGVALLGAGLAGLHAIHALALQLPAFPERHEATLVVRIADLPRAEPLRTMFPVEVEGDPASRLVGRRLRLSWYVRDDVAPPVLRAGERWRLALRLRPPRGLRNPGATDAEMHAFADRVSAMGYVVHGERLSAADGLQGWRDAASARIGRAVERPTSRFVRALALGDTRGLTDADWTLLRADGLTHLIAISGFHVGMVASVAALMARALWWLLPGLGRRVPARIAMAAAGVAGAITYAAASGFSLPTVRTLLMIVVVALACSTRRSIAMPQALAMAAVAMLLVDPLCVLSAGFWLSFAGVAWLLWCMPRAGASPVRDLVRAQGVATVGLLPLTVVLFGQASLAGPLANLVAVPWWSLVVAPLSVAGVALDA
ncbi:MAG TPA: ComEC/Rec2 family competence protein, partial [Lysobacter sp.]|nr:ComEC/Rec2 family competence protein [Lysobacter sp.]